MRTKLVVMKREERNDKSVENTCYSIRQSHNNPTLPITIITSDLANYSALVQLTSFIGESTDQPSEIRARAIKYVEIMLEGFRERIALPITDKRKLPNYYMDLISHLRQEFRNYLDKRRVA